MIKICLYCGKEFKTFPCRNAKYCSRKCRAKAINSVANLQKWWRKHPDYVIPKEARKRAAKKMIGRFVEEKGFNWKGEKAKPRAKHRWVVKHKGHPSSYKCAHCDNQAHDWANVNHKYRRKLDDYIPLCRSCHQKYDFKMGFRLSSKSPASGQGHPSS